MFPNIDVAREINCIAINTGQLIGKIPAIAHKASSGKTERKVEQFRFL